MILKSIKSECDRVSGGATCPRHDHYPIAPLRKRWESESPAIDVDETVARIQANHRIRYRFTASYGDDPADDRIAWNCR
jgi:hypothetical protein